MSDIMEVTEADRIVEDRSGFVAEATQDAESAESCHRYVAACGVGVVPASTAQGEDYEGDRRV